MRPTPKQLVHFYSPDEWEEFILEYAIGLAEDYFQIKRIGGPNDRGADIAAFLTDRGFDGQWDCLQCKHYEDALLPSDAFPEIFKLLKAVIEGHYQLPRRYLFMAPKGCGPSLSRLLSQPTHLRAKFLDRFSGEKPLGSGLDHNLVGRIKDLAGRIDFKAFQSVEFHDMVAVHSRTRFHVERFAVPLPRRPAHDDPPALPHNNERRYVEQLLEVYAERYQTAIALPEDVRAVPAAMKHFSRQREAFYSAEALRVFARDSVHPGTYEQLQEQVYQGVVETHDRDDFRDGMERLTTVLENVVNVAVHNPLIVASNPLDKRGICHQLANADRLKWCQP